MALYTERNRLIREGMTFRELEAGGDRGFVLRVMEGAVWPRRVTTLVQQPGQDNISSEGLLFMNFTVHHSDTGRTRYAPPQPTEAAHAERVTELLQASGNPLAEVALQHLQIALETSEK
ncbi:MAG TPA: hypothetical protein PKA02_02430 [Candidatus Saccharibacteria bacterium]|nr:hypothetical protein [Candidatus Saccharibacteria bacterium]